MMFSVKMKRFFISALILCIALLGIVTFGITATVKGAELSEITLEERYNVGESLRIPAAELTIDGNAVPAKAVLIMPNGNAVSVDSVVFAVAGRYELRYEAELNGKIYRCSRYFDVDEERFAVSGNASFTYGENAYLDGVKGLNVKMGETGVFRYNKPIDLRNYTADDYFIKFYVTPKQTGQCEMGAVIIDLIDAHDPNNVLVLSTNGIFDTYVHAKKISMARCGANGQPLTALRATYNDEESRYPFTGLLANNHADYGVDIKTSMYALPDVPFIDSFAGFRYDTETKSVYCNGSPLRRDYYNNKNWYVDEQQLYLDAVAAGKPTIDFVADLDDPNMFTDPWGGFTTGEVFMEIHFEKMFAMEGNIFITSVADIEGEEFNAAQTIDNSLPFIDIDYNGYDGNDLPLAVVGSPYTVLSARSLDAYNANSVIKTKVYMAYGSKNRVEVKVSDGAFVPVYAGDYYIVYSSCGRYGDVVEKVLHVKAVEPSEVEPLSVSFDDQAVRIGKTGENIPIADYTVSGAIGRADVNVTLTFESETTAAGSKFAPAKAGTYTVKYSVKDFAGRTDEISYDVNVSVYGGPVFVDYLELPAYFSANMKYTLPEYYAYELTTGVALKRLINMGEYMVCCFTTDINVKKMYIYRQRLLIVATNKEVKSIIDGIKKLGISEIRNAEKALKIVDKDSALGYEPSMGYGGDRAHIEWKIRQVKNMMTNELAIYENGLKY